MVTDGLTKGCIDRGPLLKLAGEGVWTIAYHEPVWKSIRREENRKTGGVR